MSAKADVENHLESHLEADLVMDLDAHLFWTLQTAVLNFQLLQLPSSFHLHHLKLVYFLWYYLL
jgi:hypothetical protein